MSSRRAILYARVSTLDKQHPEAQIEQLRQEAQHRGWVIVDEITDKISGGKGDRPGLERARELLKFRRADLLAATAIDRLSRDLRHLLELHAELVKWRASLFVQREQIDTTTPTGLYAFQVLGAGAQLGRANIREAVRNGVRRAKARGKKVGRTRTVPMSTIHRAAALRALGNSWGQVKQRLFDEGLGDHNRGTISRAVSRLQGEAAPPESEGTP